MARRGTRAHALLAGTSAQEKGGLPKLVATARARWRVEQDYRELKDELGLDHHEGRSWQGFYHHPALVTTTFVFLRQEQTRLRRRAKRKVCPRPRCHRRADFCKPRSSVWVDDVLGATPASTRLTLPDGVVLVLQL